MRSACPHAAIAGAQSAEQSTSINSYGRNRVYGRINPEPTGENKDIMAEKRLI